MADSIIYFFMYFGALFSVIIALGQLVQRRSAFVNYVYALSFAGLGIWLFLISLYSSGIFDSWKYIYYPTRVEEAKRLLTSEPNRSILSIGFASGFNSNTTFIIAFSKITGYSPGQYRKSKLNSR